jgi:ketosteroid isomerase-like protein
MSSSLEDRLQLLEDERAIVNVLHVYGYGYDYGLEDEFRDCWTDDAVLSYSSRPPLVGRDAIMEFFRAHTHAPLAFHKHLVVEPRIQVSGASASAQSYYARLDPYEDGPQIQAFGRYLDVLVKCSDGAWRFRERQAENEARRDPPAAIIEHDRRSGLRD